MGGERALVPKTLPLALWRLLEIPRVEGLVFRGLAQATSTKVWLYVGWIPEEGSDSWSAAVGTDLWILADCHQSAQDACLSSALETVRRGQVYKMLSGHPGYKRTRVLS